MTRDSHARKLDEQVRELVASILLTEVADPRVRLVTVTGAKVSSDKTLARVYVSAHPSRYQEVLAGLESASGLIRSLVGKALGWRVSPELRFEIDESVDVGERIDRALRAVKEASSDARSVGTAEPPEE